MNPILRHTFEVEAQAKKQMVIPSLIARQQNIYSRFSSELLTCLEQLLPSLKNHSIRRLVDNDRASLESAVHQDSAVRKGKRMPPTGGIGHLGRINHVISRNLAAQDLVIQLD